MLKHRFCISCSVLVAILYILVVWQEGAQWRIPEQRLYPASNKLREMESAFCQNTQTLDDVKLGSQANQPIITCSHDIKSDKNIYVWGDSHARHLLPGLVINFPAHNIHILYLTSCLSQSGIGNYIYNHKNRTALKDACIDRNKRALTFFQQKKPVSIIIHQYFGYEGQFSTAWYDSTNKIIDELIEDGHKVAFIGGVLRPGVALAECIAVPATIPDRLLNRRCKGDPALNQKIFHWNEELSQKIPYYFINTNSIFCINEKDCPAVDGSNLIYRDKHHLTVFGSKKLIKSAYNQISDLLGFNITQN